jgi:hypothetical protein
MLYAKFKNAYTCKSTGMKRASYLVSGPQVELDAYKAAQGSYLREDAASSQPLIFADVAINLAKSYPISTYEGRFYVDFQEVTAAAGSIENAEKRGNARLADAIASQVASSLRGNAVPSALASAISEAVETAAEADLSEPITSVKK